MVENDTRKLMKLLSYLIDHNKEHGEELKKLTEKVKEVAGNTVQGHILEVAQLMGKSTNSLIKALSELSEG